MQIKDGILKLEQREVVRHIWIFMFAIFKDFSLLNPDDDLQNCLHMIKTNCLTKLKLEELEVLDDVDYLTRKLSPQTALKIRGKTTKCRQIILANSKHDKKKKKTYKCKFKMKP